MVRVHTGEGVCLALHTKQRNDDSGADDKKEAGTTVPFYGKWRNGIHRLLAIADKQRLSWLSIVDYNNVELGAGSNPAPMIEKS